MATHAHSTTAPIVQPRLLRGGGTVPCRVLTTDELLEEIRRTIEGQEGKFPLGGNVHSGLALAAEESTARQPCDISRLSKRKALASTAPEALLPTAAALPKFGDLKSATVADLAADQITHAEYFNLANSCNLKTARALHLRRELHQALDYGFALLDALDLPPLALDVIDDAIATMDALDAPDEDREDGGDAEASLGWTAAGACSGYDFDDREHDTADAELSCGWTDKVSQIHLGVAQDEHEMTALERFGKGFIRSGPDDAEDGHDAETVFEDGSEDEPYGWRFQRSNAVQIAARVSEVARHG